MFPFNTHIKKIGVLYGGMSSEREISLKSGDAVYGALVKEGLDVERIDITSERESDVRQVISDAAITIAFIALHGRFGEDGTIQRILEDMDIPYVGSDSLASAFAMDKLTSRRIFQDHNIRVPDYYAINRYDYDDSCARTISLPAVIKPQAQGSSIGVSIVHARTQVDAACKYAFSYDDTILIDAYIKGREITVGILDQNALTPIEIVPKASFFDFHAKYDKEVTEYYLPAPLAPDVAQRLQRIALKAHRVLGCRHFSRVDMILDDTDRAFVLEVNTIPGFTATSLVPKAAAHEGITFTQFCLKLLECAYSEQSPLVAA